MIALWYGILAFMLTTYIVLDGRNFGAGILHWIVARNQPERRQVIAAIGPLWSWHEVWLVGTGGVMVMAFPRLMAASFSGCYLALFLILWCVLLRGIFIEVGGHLSDRLWQEFWDSVFVFSNVLLAVLFGAALGNIARGVPLTRRHILSAVFYQFQYPWECRVARLVHCPDGAVLCPYFDRSRSDLPDHEDRRSSTRTIGQTGSQTLVGSDSGFSVNHITHLVCASGTFAGDRVPTTCLVYTSDLRCECVRDRYRYPQPARTSRCVRVDFSALRFVDDRSGRAVSGHALLDYRIRPATNRCGLRRARCQCHHWHGLVVSGADFGLRLSLYHSATLLGQSERSQGQPRILLRAGGTWSTSLFWMVKE
jgi:hypothetical protein